jgi:hypothetical protein
MARKNDKTTPKPSVRERSGKGKPKLKAKRTVRPGGKRPKTPADEDAVVSRVTMIRHPGRGGRGR